MNSWIFTLVLVLCYKAPDLFCFSSHPKFGYWDHFTWLLYSSNIFPSLCTWTFTELYIHPHGLILHTLYCWLSLCVLSQSQSQPLLRISPVQKGDIKEHSLDLGSSPFYWHSSTSRSFIQSELMSTCMYIILCMHVYIELYISISDISVFIYIKHKLLLYFHLFVHVCL